MDIDNLIENALSTIIRPGLNFNFYSSEIRFFKNCSTNSICSKGCSAKRFGTYALPKGLRYTTAVHHCRTLLPYTTAVHHCRVSSNRSSKIITPSITVRQVGHDSSPSSTVICHAARYCYPLPCTRKVVFCP